jgi:hypothetical protein
MGRSALLALVLVLPALAHGAIWRWHDAAGGLHYSNVAEHVPAHAEPVRRPLGRLSIVPAAPTLRPHRREPERSPLSTVALSDWPRRSASWGSPCTVPLSLRSGILPAWAVPECALPAQSWLIEAVTQLERRKCPGC